jgi:hypothetical protein
MLVKVMLHQARSRGWNSDPLPVYLQALLAEIEDE